MKHTTLLLFLANVITASACATPSPPAPVAPQTTSLAGPPARLVQAPMPGAAGAAGSAEAKLEVRVLVDEPALKLVAIALRQGTPLPEHHSQVPVTIQALQGAGTVIAGAERFRLDRGGVVVLAANVPHAVQPDPGVDMVLLVHHLGRGKETH